MFKSSPLKAVQPLQCLTLLGLFVTAGPLWAETNTANGSAQSVQSSAAQMMKDLANNIEVSGFLSLRGGRINANDVEYADVMNTDWSFSKESVVGLQVKSRVSDKLTMSMQVKAKTSRSSVQLEWGYLEYAFAPDLKLRAGRLRTPGYMLSEYLDVGYAYPWVQVPYEVYGWLPFSHYEGLDLRYWTSVGDADLRINPYIGTTGNQSLTIGNIDYTDEDSQFAGLDLQLTYDIFTLRAGYSQYWFKLKNSVLDRYVSAAVNGVQLVPDMSPYISGVKIPGLTDYVKNVMVGDGNQAGTGVLADAIAAIQQDPNWSTNPAESAQVALLQSEQSSLLSQLTNYQNIPTMDGNNKGEFYGVGFSADNGKYQIMSEVSRAMIDGVYPDVESGYIMVGYRFGNWMPNFTFAKMYTVNDKERPNIQPLQLNPLIWTDPSLAPVAAGANAYTSGLITAMNIVRLEQQSYTLGVRWDPVPGLDVKAEASYVDLKNGSYGFAFPSAMLANADSSLLNATDSNVYPQPKNSITAFRVAMDLVF